jgi:hypothetical protein
MPEKPFEIALSELLAEYQIEDPARIDDIVTALEIEAMALNENPERWDEVLIALAEKNKNES